MKRLKDLLNEKGIRNVDLVRALGVDPGRVSMFVNGVFPLPKKHHQKIGKILGISSEEVTASFIETRLKHRFIPKS